MKKSRKTLIALIVFALLIALAAAVWFIADPLGSANSLEKTLSVTVIHGDGSEKRFVIKTNEEFLAGALEQEKLIEGREDQYGLWISAADGEAADESAQQWWCITKGGETVMTGADMTPVADGESYELTLKTGW